jgi:hypothetical protein
MGSLGGAVRDQKNLGTKAKRASANANPFNTAENSITAPEEGLEPPTR